MLHTTRNMAKLDEPQSVPGSVEQVTSATAAPADVTVPLTEVGEIVLGNGGVDPQASQQSHSPKQPQAITSPHSPDSSDGGDLFPSEASAGDYGAITVEEARHYSLPPPQEAFPRSDADVPGARNTGINGTDSEVAMVEAAAASVAEAEVAAAVKGASRSGARKRRSAVAAAAAGIGCCADVGLSSAEEGLSAVVGGVGVAADVAAEQLASDDAGCVSAIAGGSDSGVEGLGEIGVGDEVSTFVACVLQCLFLCLYRYLLK